MDAATNCRTNIQCPTGDTEMCPLGYGCYNIPTGDCPQETDEVSAVADVNADTTTTTTTTSTATTVVVTPEPTQSPTSSPEVTVVTTPATERPDRINVCGTNYGLASQNICDSVKCPDGDVSFVDAPTVVLCPFDHTYNVRCSQSHNSHLISISSNI